jgi:ketosteroid isomerase-like protein
MIFDYRDVNVVVFDPQYAYSTAIVALAWKMKNGSAVNLLDRTTDVWQKIGGKWLIIHEHNSVPVDMVTGKAVFNAGMSGATQPFQTK